jgi:hypothetical protein
MGTPDFDHQLYACADVGSVFDLSAAGDPDQAALREGSIWGEARTISAEIVSTLLTGPASQRNRLPHAVRIRGARISGTLDLGDRTIGCPLELTDCYLDGVINLEEADIRRLRLLGCAFPGLLGTRLRVRGPIDLSRSRAEQVVLAGARVEGPLRLAGSRIASADTGIALNAESAHISGHVACNEGFTAVGEVRLAGARISGQLNLGNAHLVATNRPALLGDGMKVDVGMMCTPGFVADGELRLPAAEVTGQLCLDDAALTNASGAALMGDGVRVSGAVTLRNATVNGELRLPAADISGQLSLSGAKLTNPSGQTLTVHDSRIAGGVYCNTGFSSEGELFFIAATITGTLNLNGAHLVNKNGPALMADGVKVDGTMFCGQGFTADGELRVADAKIAGSVSLSGARLTSATGRVLIADSAQIDGDLFCRDGFSSNGEVRLIRTQVMGQLSLRAAQLEHASGTAIDLERAHVGHLLLTDDTQCAGVVNLTDARVVRLQDDWPTTRYEACLNGLTYDVLEPLAQDTSVRLQWLTSARGGYSTQPFEQLVTILRGMGRTDAARSVAVAKEVTRRSELGLPSLIGNYLLAITVGYGYKVWRGLGWLLGIAVAGALVYSRAQNEHEIAIIHRPDVTAPAFHAWLYSLDTVLPVVSLGQEEYWAPKGFALYWHTVSMLAGWVLVTLILGTLTTRFVRD